MIHSLIVEIKRKFVADLLPRLGLYDMKLNARKYLVEFSEERPYKYIAIRELPTGDLILEDEIKNFDLNEIRRWFYKLLKESGWVKEPESQKEG